MLEVVFAVARFGSGVVVSPGHIVTNRRVLGDYKFVRASLGEEVYPAIPIRPERLSEDEPPTL